MRIEHIDDLLPAIEGRKEFVVIEKEGYTVIDYVYQDKNTFDDPRRLECRGIKFDRDGRILARPLQKFFNLGEKEQPHEVDFSRSHVILEKLDGSMIHPAMVDGQLVLMTRKGITNVADQATRHFWWQSEFSKFMLHCLQELKVTPTFEYTGPNNRIVIQYDEPALTLIGMRYTVMGEHMTNREMKSLAQDYGIPYAIEIPSLCTLLYDDDVATFMEHVHSLKDKEGYVIRFDDGHMLKVKAKDYVMKHRALDGMSSKKKVLALVVQGFVDDVTPILNDADRAELLDFNTAVLEEIEYFVDKIKRDVENYRSVSRKSFAMRIASTFQPPQLRSALFRHLDGKDARQAVMVVISRHPEIIETKWRGE